MLSMLLNGELTVESFIARLVATAAVIFLTLPIHEFAHGYVAVKLGDPTPKYQKRLTLNPFAHLDLIGSLAILLFGFGWAKPVQVNARNFKEPKLGMALTAFAGPIANILMAFIFLLLLNLFSFIFGFSLPVIVWYFLIYVAQINVTLAVFNLIPIPPLDGSKILMAALSDRAYYKIMQYERYFFIIIFVLMFSGALGGVINTASNGIITALDNLARLPFAIFN